MTRSSFATVLLVAAMALAGCSNPGKSACSKAQECCSVLDKCTEINSEGSGYVDRCGIALNAEDDSLSTWNSKLCDAISSAYDDYLSCLGGVSCSDIATGTGEVAKCDSQAKAYCNAQRSSGDACGADYSNKDCDNYIATFDNSALP